jgi:acyl-CoA reductase-like NAD-dependent aldehyde dehydrogenase
MTRLTSNTPLPNAEQFSLLINGQTVTGDLSLDVINPATGSVCAKAPAASTAQLQFAVTSAANAFTAWSATAHETRQSKLQQLATVLRDNLEALTQLLTLEQGKPLAQAQEEINYAADFLDYFSSLPIPHKQLTAISDQCAELHYHPLGVVGAIVPWNFPILLAAFKIGPALVSGNCVILKTAPSTPLTTLKIAELASTVFPSGVFNVLAGDNELGAAMTCHPGIQKIAFTGSTDTGKKVMAAAAATLKRLTLELGGNDAAIILHEADIKQTAAAIFATAFLNAGQTCIAVKRVYVHSSMFDPLMDEFAKCLQSACVGSGAHPSTTIGPVQNRRQYERLKDLLKRSVSASSRVISANCPETDGYFIKPTVISGIDDNSPIVTEEQFGPILPVLSFESEAEVVARVNQSNFGLGASIWSKDLERAQALAPRIASGTVWINQHLALLPSVPLSGVKQSGLGHELGEDSLEQFMSAQVVMTPRSAE